MKRKDSIPLNSRSSLHEKAFTVTAIVKRKRRRKKRKSKCQEIREYRISKILEERALEDVRCGASVAHRSDRTPDIHRSVAGLPPVWCE
jgi:hypothetical protein